MLQELEASQNLYIYIFIYYIYIYTYINIYIYYVFIDISVTIVSIGSVERSLLFRPSSEGTEARWRQNSEITKLYKPMEMLKGESINYKKLRGQTYKKTINNYHCACKL